jgi:hypothetical protein
MLTSKMSIGVAIGCGTIFGIALLLKKYLEKKK